MLNPDPAKVRYLGIDLHSRTRRRIVVLVTWILFFVGMSVLTFALDTPAFFRSHSAIGLYCALLFANLFTLGSVFREGSVLKRFDLPVWRLRSLGGKQFVLIRDLNGWAKYQYGAPLAELSEEQQHEVLLKYRVGSYLFPADKSKTPERLDEREIVVRDQASRNVLRWITLLCFCLAGSYACKAIPLRPIDVSMTFITLGIAAFIMPKSIILWNEPDPRISGDLQPVEQTP
ncbi:hypothetical protein [Terracidiphilus sp.]|jgi:hypothetical protein|uniref:hypothetical protein n=1 Tax=Terracidiphilus sp. TaxID=1964191 RepID=UPI003C192359